MGQAMMLGEGCLIPGTGEGRTITKSALVVLDNMLEYMYIRNYLRNPCTEA